MTISKIRFFCLILQICLIAVTPVAQSQSPLREDVQFEQLRINNESFQHGINCIYQDKKGYMWFGTWLGLYKYDGNQLTLFKPDINKNNAIKDRKIRKIFEDSRGNLWIGTMHEGLYRFNREKEEFIQYKNDASDHSTISNNDVTEIVEDRKGNIWVGTADGLNLLISEKWLPKEKRFKAMFKRFHVQNENFVNDRINNIYQDKRDRIWIAAEAGLYYYDSRSDSNWPFVKFVFQPEHNYYEENHFYSIIETEDRTSETTLWLGTRGGLKKMVIDDQDHQWFKSYKYQTFARNYKNPSSIGNNRVKSLYQSPSDKNSIWIGTEDGLYKLNINAGEFSVFKTNYNDPNSISNNIINSIYEDRSGVLWLGTEKGANKIDLFRKQFKLFQAFESGTYTGLSDNYVTSIAAGARGTMWIGTSGGGLNKMLLDPLTGFPKQISRIKLAKQDNSNPHYIYSLSVDRLGRVWVATNGGGIYRFAESDVKGDVVEKFVHYSSQSGNNILRDDYVLSTYRDAEGNILIGAWNEGLNKFDIETDQFIRFKDFHEIPKEVWKYPITSICEDKKGKIWIGTRGGGVFSLQFRKNRWTSKAYTQSASWVGTLSNNFINFVYEDKRHNLWIGTEGGLNLLEKDSEKFKVFAEKDGFPSDIFQAIVEDESGDFWISSNKGLSKLSLPLNPTEKLAIRNYNREDGLQGDIFNNNSGLTSDKGVVFFGGINGLNAFYPEDIINNKNLPQVEITNFLIFNKQVKIGTGKSGNEILKKPINETNQIELRYNENSISFEFASLHFASPSKNQYAYKMTGFDNDWIYTRAPRNMASYTNLDPGSYRFEVRASNNDGVWSKEVAKIDLVINPPFWKTPLAYIVYCLFILFILYLLRSWLLMKVNYRHNLHLERVKREQVEMVNQLKIKFFTNISHEIRTPLTLILGSLEKVISYEGLNAKIYNQLMVMQKNGNMMLRLISELLDFRKLESGHLGLHVANGNIVNFLNGIFIAFKDLAIQRQINYRFEAQQEMISLYYDRDKLEKIVFNLLSNAFKFTTDKGFISLSVGMAETDEVVRMTSSGNNEVLNVPYVRIRVKDNGVGISADQLDKIFELYYQADSHDPYHQNTGTGIGLSLCKSLVELHKGHITVNSDEGRGSAFTVYLPTGTGHLNKSEIIEDFKGSEHKNHYTSLNIPKYDSFDKSVLEDAETGKDSPLLLIVEDNNDVRTFIKQCFEDEYRVITASNGNEGLKAAMERIPDLIISDVIMPEMDGLEFCRKIKTNEKTSHIPLILLTARTSLIYKTEGLETGADDYITKPFNANILTIKVRNLLKLKQNLSEKFASKKYLKPLDITTNSMDEAFLNKAIENVNAQMANPDYTTEDLGRSLAMSRMQLYRKLKVLTGLTPVEFIRNQRIQRAAQLLQNSELTISEITYEVGFSDLKYFRKCFKDYYKVNPSEYVAKE